MTVERYLRLSAGFFVVLSLALGYWVNPQLRPCARNCA